MFQTMLPFYTKLPIQVTWSKLSCLSNGNQTKLPLAEPCPRGGEGGGGELVDFYDGGDHVHIWGLNLGKINIFGV